MPFRGPESYADRFRRSHTGSSGLAQVGPSVSAPPLQGGDLGKIDRTGPLGGPFTRGPMANLNPTLGETMSLAQRASLPYGMAGKSAGIGHAAQDLWEMIGLAVKMRDQQAPGFYPASDYVDPTIPYEGYGLAGHVGPSPFALHTPEGRYTFAEQESERTGPHYMDADTSWSRRRPRIDYAAGGQAPDPAGLSGNVGVRSGPPSPGLGTGAPGVTTYRDQSMAYPGISGSAAQGAPPVDPILLLLQQWLEQRFPGLNR